MVSYAPGGASLSESKGAKFDERVINQLPDGFGGDLAHRLDVGLVAIFFIDVGVTIGLPMAVVFVRTLVC